MTVRASHRMKLLTTLPPHPTLPIHSSGDYATRRACTLVTHPYCRSYLSATARRAQHYSVSTLLNSTNSFSTLLDFNTSAFNTSCIQHYSYSTSTYSTHLAFNTPRIQHFLYSTLLDFNNHGFNTTCFQHPWFQHSLFSTILVFNNPCFFKSSVEYKRC